MLQFGLASTIRVRVPLSLMLLLSAVLLGTQAPVRAQENGGKTCHEAPALTEIESLAIDVKQALGPEQPQRSLEEASREAGEAFEKVAPDLVPKEEAEELWNEIQRKVESGHIGKGLAQLLLPRLRSLLTGLTAKGKLRYLTEDSKKKMGLDQYLCDSKGKCKTLKAFYVPLTHHVFLESGLSKDQKADSLFHELMHAFQYAYRFPLDAGTLAEASKEGRLPQDQVGEYLGFHLESQAHWYTAKISPPPQWVPLMGKKPGGLEVAARTLGKTALSALLLGIPMVLTDNEMQELLPKDDQFCYTSSVAICVYDGGPGHALRVSELVPMRNVPASYMHGGENLEFHREFGRGIEKAHFERLPFLFRSDKEDLKLGLELHNQYRDRIARSDEVDRGACAELISKVMSSDTSPLVQWLSMPKAEIEACSAYQDKVDSGYRDKFTQTYLGGINPKSPFGMLRPDGGDGSRPDLRVVPVLIQPQLEITPVVEDKLGQNPEKGDVP